MPSRIIKRKLSENEISSLAEESRKSAHIGLIKPSLWKKFKDIYVAEDNEKLVGICAIFHLKNWIKIGPIIVLGKEQGKGIGKALISTIIQEYPKSNFYIGSSNPRVKSIASKCCFIPVSFLLLPFEIKIYLLSYIYQRLGVEYLVDGLKKKIMLKKEFSFYCLRRI
jgi:GNAT superfamily N-acetyltransferase